MISCDVCEKKIDRADEHDLVLWTLFKKIGFKVRLMIEAIPTGPDPARHLCPGCKMKIMDALMKKPLAEPPQLKAKNGD